MIIFTHKTVKFGELWFEEPHESSQVDILLYYQWSTPVGEVTKEFWSIEIDLTRDDESLLGAMTKNTRYEIGRAGKKDGVTFEFFARPDGAILGEFCSFFDQFAESRNLDKSNERWLRTYCEQDALALSRVRDANGVVLVWHNYYKGPKWCRQLQSASEFRQTEDPGRRRLVSRANRYHHWCDMLAFKELGTCTFDFGGWYEGKDDEQKLRINQFKEEFGGTVNKRYHSTAAVTLKGKTFLWAYTMKNPQHDKFLHMV